MPLEESSLRRRLGSSSLATSRLPARALRCGPPPASGAWAAPGRRGHRRRLLSRAPGSPGPGAGDRARRSPTATVRGRGAGEPGAGEGAGGVSPRCRWSSGPLAAGAAARHRALCGTPSGNGLARDGEHRLGRYPDRRLVADLRVPVVAVAPGGQAARGSRALRERSPDRRPRRQAPGRPRRWTGSCDPAGRQRPAAVGLARRAGNRLRPRLRRSRPPPAPGAPRRSSRGRSRARGRSPSRRRRSGPTQPVSARPRPPARRRRSRARTPNAVRLTSPSNEPSRIAIEELLDEVPAREVAGLTPGAAQRQDRALDVAGATQSPASLLR